MTLKEKYEGWKDIFWDIFIMPSPGGDEKGTNIPLQEIYFDRGIGVVGDGTVNLAYLMTYLLLAESSGIDTPIGLDDCLNTLRRLERSAMELYKSFPWIYEIFDGKPVNGFFLRDDIPYDGWKGLETINGAYGGWNGVLEDPCFSPFTSQDQVWNLSPVLMSVMLAGGHYEAKEIGFMMNKRIQEDGYKVTNPYLSWISHYHKYLPSMNENKVKPWERIEDRNKHFKNTEKVKRGANNWYYSGGTKAAVDAFSMRKCDYKHSFRTFVHRGVTFFLDRIWFPIVRILGGEAKENAIYCYAGTSGIWYGPYFSKRLAKRFNDSLNGEELFSPNVAVNVLTRELVDWEKVKAWLERYPEPVKSGAVKSPIEFMYMYEWFNLSK